MILYHGTDKSNLDKIISKGLKPFECSDFGKAVYLSDNYEFSEGYGDCIIKTNVYGSIMDLNNPTHWDLYKSFHCNNLKECVTAAGFVGIKDGNIYAIYKTKAITVIPE